MLENLLVYIIKSRIKARRSIEGRYIGCAFLQKKMLISFTGNTLARTDTNPDAALIADRRKFVRLNFDHNDVAFR